MSSTAREGRGKNMTCVGAGRNLIFIIYSLVICLKHNFIHSHFRVALYNVQNGYLHPSIFSVNKCNCFQDTSRLQKKLVWLSWGGGGVLCPRPMCLRRGSVRVLTDTASVSNTCSYCSLTQPLTDMCFRRASVRVMTVAVRDHILVRSHLGVLETDVPAQPCRVQMPCKTSTGGARRSTNPGL